MEHRNDSRHPEKILLATDLSCRCDRALDRAVAAAKEWQAQLIASTVVDHDSIAGERMTGGSDDPVVRARRRLAADVASTDIAPRVKVRTGDVIEQLLLLANEEDVDLVVTGVARNNWLRAVVLGTVVDGLMRHAEVPILVVRHRVRGSYRKIVVAGDFSELSKYILIKTLEWFPKADISFFHAIHLPYADLADPNRDSLNEQCRQEAWAEARAFIDNAGLSPEERARIKITCESGSPVEALNHHVSKSAAELVVVGGNGRGVLFEILIGSKAKQIVENIDCDVLVVRNPQTLDT